MHHDDPQRTVEQRTDEQSPDEQSTDEQSTVETFTDETITIERRTDKPEVDGFVVERVLLISLHRFIATRSLSRSTPTSAVVFQGRRVVRPSPKRSAGS